MNSSKKDILEYLLTVPARENVVHGKSIIEIAAAVNLSTNAVRKYLYELEQDGFVVGYTQKREVGRPSILYSLHSNALSLFPKFYAEFAVSLIDELRNELGESRTRKILSEVGKTMGKDILNNDPGKMNQLTIEQRIVTLVKIFEDSGKFPTVSEDKEYYYIRNSNCLLFSVVKKHSILCEVDHNIVKVMLGTQPEKQQCLKNGDAFCQYRINKDSHSATEPSSN